MEEEDVQTPKKRFSRLRKVLKKPRALSKQPNSFTWSYGSTSPKSGKNRPLPGNWQPAKFAIKYGEKFSAVAAD